MPILLQLNLVPLKYQHITPLRVNIKGLDTRECIEKTPSQNTWNNTISKKLIVNDTSNFRPSLILYPSYSQANKLNR